MTGRPTKYDPAKHPAKVFRFALLGLTDVEIADALDVCESTLNNWKIEYPEFLESIKKGKDSADAKVAQALYHRALGYRHESEEIKVIDSKVVKVPIIKQYPPDPASAIFWLKNRQSKRWRDRFSDIDELRKRLEALEHDDRST